MARSASVTPLLFPNINWDEYLKYAASLTGHTLTHLIDNSAIKFGQCSQYLLTLFEFQNHNYSSVDPLGKLKNANHILNHLFFSFIVKSSAKSILEIAESTDLYVLSTRVKDRSRAAIVSGTLKQWKEFLSIETENQDVVSIIKQCRDIFIKLKLQEIFKGR